MAQTVHKLHVVERGQGRPVLLLHGTASTHRFWKDVGDRLEADHKVITPDLLGFGNSPKPRKGVYDLDQYMACLRQTFEEYEFSQPPVLVGHSMGSEIALHWALLEPARFAGVVLISPALIEPEKKYQQMAGIIFEGRTFKNKFVARTVTEGFGMLGLVPEWLAVLAQPHWPRHFIEDVTRQKYFVHRKIFKNDYFKDRVLEDMAKLKLPAFILAGEADALVGMGMDDLRRLCAKRPNYTLNTVTTGHQVPLEHPELVVKAIRSL